MSNVWFITGASSGFGRCLTAQALKSGAQVVATARQPESLNDLTAQYPDTLRVCALDVTDSVQVKAAVAFALEAFGGRLDVVVNNAGYGLMGALEECGEDQLQRNLATNFLGPLAVMRAVLPTLRAQKSGHIINMSAVAAFSNHPGFSVYGGSKAALDAASDSVRDEVKPLGIKVTIVVPGPFRTDFVSRSMEDATQHIPDYDPTSGKFAAYLHKIDGVQAGNPDAAARVIVQMIADGKAPMRLFLGKYALDIARRKMAIIERELAEWETASLGTEFPK